MPPTDPKYVTSNRRVNQRTTPSSDPETQSIPPIVKGRLAAIKAKHQFGVPLADQLHRSKGKSKRTTISSAIIFSTAFVFISSLALAMAALEKSTISSGISISGILLGLVFLYRSVRAKGIVNDAAIHNPPLFDETSLRAFDQVLEQTGKELEEDMVEQLNRIKAQILRIDKLADLADSSEHLSVEDRHYLGESLRRYLPDSLQSYLQVPVTARATKMLNTDQTANDLLRQQLTLLQNEFDKHEQTLTKNAADHLLRQQRFLEEKAKNK